MDMDILLFLQEFRNAGGAILADFMAKMTFLGEISSALVMLALVYWCISKELGTYLFMGWSGNRLANGALKVTVCEYRPWIRDPRIVPFGDSMTTATGYSFPSGHTMNATTLFGGGALRKDLPGILRIVLALVMVLVGFSRMFLGVHAPQDVLVGAGAGLLVMWLTLKLMRWIEVHPEKDMLVVCIGCALGIAVAIYASVKGYPVDYDAEGNLIVDGAKMANDTFKGVGYCAAFLIGWVLERRYVGFSTDVSLEQKLTRAVVGIFGFYIVSLIIAPLIKLWILGPTGTTISCFIQVFYIVFLFPLCLKYLERTSAVAA